MSESTRSTHLLEGDGIVSNLYYYLWKKKVASEAMGVSPAAMAADHLPAAELGIPSTVIFEHNFPKAWYYQAEQTQDIERKLGKDVDSQQILANFTKRSHASSASRRRAGVIDDTGDVVATYYSLGEDEGGKPITRVEFFDREQLEYFLFRRSRRPDGFLQKWVLSTGKYNTVVQAVWSPHVCLVSKRQNCTAIRDKTKPLYDRAVTFEGPTHYSTEVFVAPHVKWQVKCVCEELVDHLVRTQRIAISRMVLYFKVDHNSNIWLLYCSSMRVTDRHQLNLAPCYSREAKNEAQLEQMTAQRIAKLLKETFDDEEEGEGTATTANATGRGRRASGVPQPPAHPSRTPGIRRPGVSSRTIHQLAKEPAPRGAFGGTLTPVKWPAPPSMGRIGDVYSEHPDWEKKQQMPLSARSQYMLNGRRIPRSPRKKHKKRSKSVVNTTGTIDGEAVPIAVQFQSLASPNKTTTGGVSPRATGHRGSSPSMRAPELSGGFRSAGVSTEEAFRERDPKTLWTLVRMSVQCRFSVEQRYRRELHDWATTFQYCVYSHFLSSRTSLIIHIPLHFDRLLRNPQLLATVVQRQFEMRQKKTTGGVPVATTTAGAADDHSTCSPGLSSVPHEDWLAVVGVHATDVSTDGKDEHIIIGGDETLPTAQTTAVYSPSVSPGTSRGTNRFETREIRVQKLTAPLVEFQTNVRLLLNVCIDRPFAALWWFYVAKKWIFQKNQPQQQSSSS